MLTLTHADTHRLWKYFHPYLFVPFHDMTTQQQVLYLDQFSHPAPLSLCYHVSGSQLCCRAPHRLPPCTISTEIESGYCPQCLSFWDASAVLNNRGICTHSISLSQLTPLNQTEEENIREEEHYIHTGGGCKACPICNSILVMEMLPDYSLPDKPIRCMWSCGYCHWNSTECDISVPLQQDNIDATIASLQATLGKRIVESTHVRNTIVDTLHTEFKQKYLEEVKIKRQRDLLAMHGLILNQDGVIKDEKIKRNIWNKNNWSLEDLEKELENKKERIKSPHVHGDKLWNFKKPLDISYDTLHDSKLLLPLPVRLLPRTIRRCRTQVAAGRPGILVKPKSNPMDGDSSLKYGHGQWFKKDSSAIHTIPKVQILNYGTDLSTQGRFYAFLLLVTNPSLETMQLSLFRDANVIHQHTLDSKLKNLIIDPCSLATVSAIYESPLSTMVPTVTFTLEPVEDLFLDSGATSQMTRGILDWDASMVLSNNTTTSFRIVGQEKDRAWIEYVLDRDTFCNSQSDHDYIASPINLKVEGGESSNTDLDEMNMFTILLLWKTLL